MDAFVEQYHHMYDDHDRYFNFMYDVHETLVDTLKDAYILDRETFTDFFNFCLTHMNRNVVDATLISEHAVIRKTEGKKC
jgi:hypothetical protein